MHLCNAMNLSNLNLRDLRLLLTLFETGNLTAAARRVCLSTPVASRMLADMRHYFGDPLFVRRSQGMTPTPIVLRMIPTIQQIVSLTETLGRADYFDPQAHEGIVRIAMLDHVMMSFLTKRFLFELNRLAPKTQVEFRLVDQELDKRLANGEIDMAVWPSDQFGPNFHSHSLHRSRCYLTVRRNHALHRLQSSLPEGAYVPIEEIVRFPKIACAYSQASWTGLFDFEERQQTLCWVPMYSAAAYWAATCDATLSLPNGGLHATFKKLDLVQIFVRPEHAFYETNNVKLVWHDRVHHDPMQIWVRGIFSQIFNKESQALAI